jgi:hypothetical protein
LYFCLSNLNSQHCATIGHPILGDDLYHTAGSLPDKVDRVLRICHIAERLELEKSGADAGMAPLSTDLDSQILCYPSVRRGMFYHSDILQY